MLGYVAIALVLALVAMLGYFASSYFSKSDNTGGAKLDKQDTPDSTESHYQAPKYDVSTDREVEPDARARSTELNTHKSIRISDVTLAKLEASPLESLSYMRNHSNAPESANIYHDRARGTITVLNSEGSPLTLKSPMHDPGSMFGSSFVRLSDGRFVVGARGYPMSTSAGAVVCYAKDGSIVSIVNHPDPFFGAMFGWSVEALETDEHTYLVVGAPLHRDTGEVYVYVWDDDGSHPVLAGTLGKTGISQHADMLRFGTTIRHASDENLAIGYQNAGGTIKEALYRVSEPKLVPTMDRYDGEVFLAMTVV